MTNVAAERRRAAAKTRRVERARLAAVQIRALAKEGMARLYVSDAEEMFAYSTIIAAVDVLIGPDWRDRLDNLSMLQGAAAKIERLTLIQLEAEDEREHLLAPTEQASPSNVISFSDALERRELAR